MTCEKKPARRAAARRGGLSTSLSYTDAPSPDAVYLVRLPITVASQSSPLIHCIVCLVAHNAGTTPDRARVARHATPAGRIIPDDIPHRDGLPCVSISTYGERLDG